MQYLMTFIEGIITFISPCMLPMLPLYVSYFAGEANKKSKTFLSALSFVAGFTVVFSALGLFAGSIGSLLSKYHRQVDVISGIIIILLGLNFLDIIKIPFLKGHHSHLKASGAFSAFIFGIVFSISHAPCIGAFLGTALVTASASGTAAKGVLMLLSYSFGLGVPFLLSAILIEKLTKAISAIKRNYSTINLVCGIFLIIIGVCMITGLYHELIHLVS